MTLLDYLYEENMKNKIYEMGKMIGAENLPDNIVEECLKYVNQLFIIIEERLNEQQLDNTNTEIVFFLVDIILLKHLTLLCITKET